jgi:hypothetical protein
VGGVTWYSIVNASSWHFRFGPPAFWADTLESGSCSAFPAERAKPSVEQKPRLVSGFLSVPDGFEYKEAEMGNTVHCRVDAGGKFTFEFKNTYAQLNAFDLEQLTERQA